ncbi:MAG: U32 family peptidase [Anaerovoracaceae bacterium]|nr:U32 family peptidase [Anaerovoracaceae bacterium]
MDRVELLAPAGDLEKLKAAVDYGADAVYFGGSMFSLRAGAGNFSEEDMRRGVSYAHERGVKCHLTLNIFPHNEDIVPIEDYLDRIKDIGIDAFIVSDPGTVLTVMEKVPEAEVHLSTQANMTNAKTAQFWKDIGVKRIVLARELTLGEIAEINRSVDIDTECFVHGAMCISYSGRCLLSNFMTERDANRGMCAHPCRWKYRLEEEKRPGQYYPIEEDDRGTYIMNSGDLCMIEHMADVIGSGVSSVKIEGRMKSMFYVATVTQAYRRAIDAYYEDPEGYAVDPSWLGEVKKVSHREFTTGFYYDRPTNKDQNYRTSEYTRDYSFVGKVLSYDSDSGIAEVEQRNKMLEGDEVEIFGPGAPFFTQKITGMRNEEGELIDAAPHPQQRVTMKTDRPVAPGYIIRKKKGEKNGCES